MSWWSRQSLVVKFPVALVGLMAMVFVAFAGLMYWETRGTLLALASHRLGYASSQLADVVAGSAQQRKTLLNQVAADPELQAALRRPADPPPGAVQDRLRRYLGSSGTARIDLWSADGRLWFSSGAEFPPVPEEEVRARLSGDPGPVIGRLRADAGRVTYATWIQVTDDTGLVGVAVERRSLNTQSTTVNLLATMIGESATILVGNADGSVWTDLSQSTPQPGVPDIDVTALVEHQSAFARATPISGTPWLSIVEFPRSEVLAPWDRLVARVAWLMGVFTVGAAGLGWIVARRVTAPLRQVTAAAELVAAAKPAPRLQWRREDEVGRLARSFNTMADNVADSRQQYATLVRELEDRVAQRTAAQQAANDELEAFSYSVSHDMRAPLRAISGFVRILMEDHWDQVPPDAQAHLKVIQRNAGHMGALIDDLLAFSRLGRQAISMRHVDTNALVAEVAEEIRRDEPGRELTLQLDPLPAVRGDRQLLRQLFANLLQNAAKFTRRQAQARIHVGTTTGDDGVVFFVRDNGAGFDMRYADKLFGVFQRLHQAEDFEGTGVGLAIVQRIVTRHGGRIWADGEVDRGAAFSFTLPLTTETAP